GVKETSDSIVFVRFRGLGVQDSTAMRAKLREEGVGYFVAKKTLLRRAFGEGYEGAMPEFEGEIAIAYSEDPIAPAQNVKEFAEKFKEELDIVGGVFQGVWKSKEEMTEIASIPPLPVLHGMFANFLQQPVQGIALAIQAVAEAKEQTA
ncbi:50S ribosomal protein L10, partial [Candidatus Pacebacteria bacterium]|nr:50S ribosomal protein L10 [Candidatus Paceibacterota bacterium]